MQRCNWKNRIEHHTFLHVRTFSSPHQIAKFLPSYPKATQSIDHSICASRNLRDLFWRWPGIRCLGGSHSDFQTEIPPRRRAAKCRVVCCSPWSNSCHADRGAQAKTVREPSFNRFLCKSVRNCNCLPRTCAILSPVCSGDCSFGRMQRKS